ncbi:protein obstructor-E-like [Toxorhynchites rutilus septentrionalis]|uniref:protein obstructor-E-like n=1 Tax=Toxorhynchites rutilus septentrionalis TaxID=329112 RepID=UPI0024797AD1|nr:protein obstructor-E-like [Toxorhynchites rutilus septentrionalis]
MNQFFLLLTIPFLGAYAGDIHFECPRENGQFEDPYQCDKYYECSDNHASELLCPDGLVFDPKIKSDNKCDQPFNVDCGDRKELQTPKPSGVCVRQNGHFPHPDSSVCNIFYNCVNGHELEVTCAAGLHFNPKTASCDWPETSGRVGCRSEANKQLDDGFQCPTDFRQIDGNGQMITHHTYPHPDDCTKFYICLNGVEPRQGACHAGLVYNEEIQRCDEPENVPGCEDWSNSTTKS